MRKPKRERERVELWGEKKEQNYFSSLFYSIVLIVFIVRHKIFI